MGALTPIIDRTGTQLIVVDDGSQPPVTFQDNPGLVDLLRTEGIGRSAARNAGAHLAKGQTILFLDDDITALPGLLEAHLAAQSEWPGVLAVGAIRLPSAALHTAFGAFRQGLENAGLPVERTLVRTPGLCAAGNMSIPRAAFMRIGGFDPGLESGEDQDLASRHLAVGGSMAFLPEACGIHRDDALDIRSYCERVERGAQALVRFCAKHPEWPENRARHRANGPWQAGEPIGLGVLKIAKRILALQAPLASLLVAAGVTETLFPRRVSERLYRLLIGLHLFRGYRRGLQTGGLCFDSSP